MGYLIRTLITAVAIAATAYVINLYSPDALRWGEVDYGLGESGRYLSLFLTAIVLGIVNGFVRPVLALVAMPITCLTLGLFSFVLNALMLLLVSAIPQLGFRIGGANALETFFIALVASVLISIVSGLLSKVVR